MNEFQQLDQSEMWTCTSFNMRHRALIQFWSTGELNEVTEYTREHPFSEYMDRASNLAGRKLSLFIKMAEYLGKDSLQLLLPSRMKGLKDRLEALKQRIENMSAGDVPEAHTADSEDWWGMEVDSYNGVFNSS